MRYRYDPTTGCVIPADGFHVERDRQPTRRDVSAFESQQVDPRDPLVAQMGLRRTVGGGVIFENRAQAEEFGRRSMDRPGTQYHWNELPARAEMPLHQKYLERIRRDLPRRR